MNTEERADREAIRTLMATYNINGDRGRLDALAATFAIGGILEFDGRATTGRDAIVARLASAPPMPGLTVVRHHLTTSLVEITGDHASARTYFQVLTDIGSDHHGVYVDRLRKGAQGWQFEHREVRIDWQAPDSLFPPLRVRRTGRPG